jgi:beta-lactamase class A
VSGNNRSSHTKTARPSSSSTHLERRNNNVRLQRHRGQNPQARRSRRTNNIKTNFVSFLFRLIIISIAFGAIGGTILINFKSPQKALTQAKIAKSARINNEEKVIAPKEIVTVIKPVDLETAKSILTLGKELTELKTKIKTLIDKYPKLETEAFFIDLDDNSYFSIDGEKEIPAASTIKVPILLAFFEDVDGGKIRLDEIFSLTKDVIGSGAGDIQYSKVGTKYTALQVARKMIIISDNTATNMIIKRLGGAEALNKRFREWGLKSTIIKNPMPDLEGTNLTTTKDLVEVMGIVDRGKKISLRSRDRLLGIMEETKTRTLLPQGLEKGAIIANKTGDIGTVVGDVGLIDMPNGKRYLGSVMLKRPYNDVRAKTLIQDISKTVYQNFKLSNSSTFSKEPI